MPHIKITKAADDQAVRVSVQGHRLTIPRDGNFHEVDDRFLPALDDSDVEYEVAPAKAGAGGAAGLGGVAAPPNDPLDHDGKAGPGGSVKGYHSTAAKGARRKKAAAKGAAKKKAAAKKGKSK